MNFKDIFEKEIVKRLQEKLSVGNPMAVPRITKIVVSQSLKEFVTDRKQLDKAQEEIALICGQKPKITRAKKAISGFKLRQGDPIGLVATLRGKRMYDFFEKLVKIAFPRVKDFSGIKEESLDQSGNLTIGFSEQTAFPEIDPGKVERIRGLEVTIVTNAKDKEQAKVLLEEMGIPFRK
jgi:large subunit ribosomal protein L5